MTKVLFIFMDGIGLGADDPETNPLARAEMPYLQALLGGRKLTASVAPYESEQVSLQALDAGLGVDGLPQSATGQAVLLTGVNIPDIEILGIHPRDDTDIVQNFFLELLGGAHDRLAAHVGLAGGIGTGVKGGDVGILGGDKVHAGKRYPQGFSRHLGKGRVRT